MKVSRQVVWQPVGSGAGSCTVPNLVGVNCHLSLSATYMEQRQTLALVWVEQRLHALPVIKAQTKRTLTKTWCSTAVIQRTHGVPSFLTDNGNHYHANSYIAFCINPVPASCRHWPTPYSSVPSQTPPPATLLAPLFRLAHCSDCSRFMPLFTGYFQV